MNKTLNTCNSRLAQWAAGVLLAAALFPARADTSDPHAATFFRHSSGDGTPAAPTPRKVELPDPTRFAVAVEAGNIGRAREWLDAGLDPEFQGDRIGSGLMIAAWEGNIPMMELFLSRGADVNRGNRFQEQALMFAAWKGRLEAVRWLLDRGAAINREGLQWSALHYATFAGQEQVARLLLERGGDINARSPNGASPLMMAAREGHEGVARMLVERGADTRVQSDWGDDATVMAMRYEHLRIAKLVSDPERFAEVARLPAASFGPPTRSVPAPEKALALEREMRFAETMGTLTREAREAYLAAIAAVHNDAERESAAREAAAAPPRALEISAKRGEPGREKAELIYDTGAAQPAAEAPKVPVTKKPRRAKAPARN